MKNPLILSNTQMQWVDADNDSLLDVLIANQINGEVKFSFLKNTFDSLKLVQTVRSGYANGKFFLTDFNSDDKIDIVISGKNNSGTDATEVFLNQGNFNFQKSSTKILNQSFNKFLFADLNNDGMKDLVGSDNNKLYIFGQLKGKFILKKDTAIRATSIKLYDFDDNVFHDIAFSGLDINNNPVTGIFFLGNNFQILSQSKIASVNGTISAGDLNSDGLFDIIVSGKNQNNSLVINSFLQRDSAKFTLSKSIVGLDSAFIKIADFTSDGEADVAFFGKNSNHILQNWIKTVDGDSILLPADNIVQDFGDYDRDGDLDLIQLRSDSVFLFQDSSTLVNEGPSGVSDAFDIQLYDRTFFYWNKAADDHTTSNSITYDLKVFDNAKDVAIAAEYDSVSYQRLLVSHGNLGTANYSLQKLLGNPANSFQVQPIDNAFVPQAKAGGGGFCNGACSGTSLLCVDLKAQNITVCKNSRATLKPASPNAMWFSFSKGFLGISDSLSYSEPDTVFSFNPQSSNVSCNDIKLFNIQYSPSDTIKLTKNIWNCEDSQNLLSVDAQWENVVWKNNIDATTSNGNSLTYVLQKPIDFFVTGKNDFSCQLKETFNLKLSKPNLQVENDHYQIAEGGSVQLSASGGDSYEWSPTSSLNNSAIADPIASPTSTTKYFVIAKDSLGCTDTTSVIVEVMEDGFVPTLFTPNGDGKNDELKIFGISSANNFRFTIYNREGNVLYETQDVLMAAQQGWNGTANGHLQPTGTYYWKIQGSHNSGETLTLNGKKSGAFLLVR